MISSGTLEQATKNWPLGLQRRGNCLRCQQGWNLELQAGATKRSWIKVLENTVAGGAKRWNAVSATTATAASGGWNLESQAGAFCSQSDWRALCSAEIVRIMGRKASKKN